MLAQQRQAQILEQVRLRGAVRVAELVAEFAVSDMTVRRDLETLARRGLLDKVHGGATVLADSSTDEPGFEVKSARERGEKLAIARRAASLVRPGQAIGLSAGTTTWTMARELLTVPRITVVTNSLHVAEVLYDGGTADQTIVLTGGIRTPSDALVGPVAIESLRSLNLDTVFLGTHGMDARSGFTTPNLMEADTNRALIASARRLVVVADHTKWGVVGISTMATFDQADALITDTGLAQRARNELTDHGVEVTLADAVLPAEPVADR
ncbi:MAG: DeoR/GlpR family DNA-binding transcription regulator [Nocardioidaceae bacterium]